MALMYVTGAPGAGKTTIQKELTKLGYEAYDLDAPMFGGPYDKKSNKLVTMPPIEERTLRWFDEHEWRVSRIAVEQLKQSAQGKTVFLCGTATTEGIILDLFDKVLYLNIDEQTLLTRIANREANDFGKAEHELNLILARYREAQESLRDSNYAIIDASGSPEDTIQKILAASSS